MSDKQYFDEKTGEPITFYIDDNGKTRKILAWNSSQEYHKADEWYYELVSAEPEITKDVQLIANKTNTELADFEYRIKSKDHYDEKYERKSKEKNRPYKANDVVRYTHLIKDKNEYVKKYREVIREYEKMGYNLVEVSNHWTNPKNPYNRINIVLKANDHPFEVQFHTRKSLEIKRKQHTLYDELKIAKNSGNTIKQEKCRFELFKLSEQLKAPQNIKEVKDVSLL